ncbi:MAG: hypothetical protein VXZ72_00135 [Chlamydiota bacterium]|nr:hypothetical protein [Chlamydiota bacterium]
MIYLSILALATLVTILFRRRAFALAITTLLTAVLVCDHYVVTPCLQHHVATQTSWLSWATQEYEAWRLRRVAACEKERRQIRAYQRCMNAWQEGRHEGDHRGLDGHCRKVAAKVE